MKEKEIELYLDNRFFAIEPKDPGQSTQVFLFFRDKTSGSGFPIVFDKSVA